MQSHIALALAVIVYIKVEFDSLSRACLFVEFARYCDSPLSDFKIVQNV